MGNEEIIYGIEHLTKYQEFVENETLDLDEPQELTEKTFYANMLKVFSWDGSQGVNVQVTRFDQKTGEPLDDERITIEMDREGINRLIRGLRKHRDLRFGRDE